ncbi:MAG TPA: hypothetical protein VGB76_00710 [Pyrinomonadaceae bacterium]|jgi:hypothetical protein
MKRTEMVLNRLTIALALATQLFLFAPATQAVSNTTPSATPGMQHESHNMQPTRRNRCRERCLREYRQCTRGVANPSQARCRQRYNQCLRRCRR